MRRPALYSMLLLALTAAPAAAQMAGGGAPMMDHVDPALLNGMAYRLVGPSQGGRVTTVTGVPSQPRTFYMGEAAGGLFKTTDGGQSWFPVTDGQVPLGSSGSVVVADSDPNVVYYGTGSDGIRSNVSTGRGVYKSTDGGKTWQFAGLRDVGQIGAVRVHPTNPDIVWVAANGNAFKPNSERGIFKTTDGGKTWKKTLFLNDSTGAMDVELQPGNPNVVYAWMNRIERKPWTIISGSREGGFYKSTDGGNSFKKITNGLPHDLVGKGNLAVSAADPNRVYALVEAKPGGGLYRSDDAGQSWQEMRKGASAAMQRTFDQMIQRPFYYTTIGADPMNADVVYAGAESFFKSTDGGHTFTRVSTPHGDNHDIWINPNDDNIMIQSNDGGANVSFDGGKTWSTQYNQPTAELYGVWTDNEFPYNLYAAQQDDGTHILSMAAKGGDRNVNWFAGPGCETGPIMPHPGNPQYVYGACKGQFEVLDRKTGQTREYWVGAQSLYGNPASDLIYRFQRVSPMETSPTNPDVVYYGSQYVHRSTDMGVTWEKISPDLTAHPACCQGVSGEPITRDVTGEEFYSTLYAITESPHDPQVIWTGSNDGPFYVTRDGGKSWTNITPKDLQPGGRVAWIDASPHRPGSAYYAVYRYLLGDFHPYLYRTDDYGKSWTLLTPGNNGIAADEPTRVVREDPVREGLLYAGTEFGMYVSFDNGAHWQPFQQNLPNVPINDIRVKNNDLILATEGRAFWIVDDITPLRQITPQTTTTAAHLFQPRDGYRTQAAPELLGPMLDYYLPSKPIGPVKIDILDGSGTVVNTFDSSRPPPPQRRRFSEEDEGGMSSPGDDALYAPWPVLDKVPAEQGMNRFVWDVRNKDRVTMPPGQYQARLTVDGSTLTQPFHVLRDPRIAAEGTTVADLQEQYQHNMRMTAMVQEVNHLADRVQKAWDRLQNATGADAETRRKLEPLVYQVLTPSIRYSKPGIQDQITYLQRMTTGADQKIGRDAIERYQTLRKELDALEAKVNAVLGPEG